MITIKTGRRGEIEIGTADKCKLDPTGAFFSTLILPYVLSNCQASTQGWNFTSMAVHCFSEQRKWGQFSKPHTVFFNHKQLVGKKRSHRSFEREGSMLRMLQMDWLH